MVSFVYQFIEDKMVILRWIVGGGVLNICVMIVWYCLFFVVDLCLYGVDEMIFQLLNIRDIRDKYMKWILVVLIVGIL